MTVAVFIGFGYLLLSDITTNLNDKLYSFTVRDKFLTEDEAGTVQINFETYN